MDGWMNELMLSRCWRASDTSEKDDDVAASYFTHILDMCTHHTHIVSLIPQQSVLLHKEDYTSGTRGFPGMGHSHPVCHHSAGAMCNIAIAGHFFTATANLTHPPQGWAGDRCEIWSSRVTEERDVSRFLSSCYCNNISVFSAWCVTRVILMEFI